MKNEVRSAQEEIMNNEQLVSSEGQFVENDACSMISEYKRRDDGNYEYTSKRCRNSNTADGIRKWVFSPTHQLIEKTDYDVVNDKEFPIEKTVWTKTGTADDMVNERTYYEYWEDDNGNEQTDYVIDAEGVIKSHSYQKSPYTKRTEEICYMKPDSPEDEHLLPIINSALTITDVRYGYTDGIVIEGIKPYDKKDAPTDKKLIGVFRVENKKHCVCGTSTVKVNLKTPTISFKSTENYGSSVDPNYKNDIKEYTVMNSLFNKPAIEVRRTTNISGISGTITTTHEYTYKDTIYGKALIDHEKSFTDICDKLDKMPAVQHMKIHDGPNMNTVILQNNNTDLYTTLNQHLFADLNAMEKNSFGRPKDYYKVTIEGGKYDGSIFYFTSSTSPCDADAGKFLWCHRISLRAKYGESTALYDFTRERDAAIANKNAIAIDKYTDFIESIVSIINNTPGEIPDRKIIRTVKSSENGDKEITQKNFYRSYPKFKYRGSNS